MPADGIFSHDLLEGVAVKLFELPRAVELRRNRKSVRIDLRLYRRLVASTVESLEIFESETEQAADRTGRIRQLLAESLNTIESMKGSTITRSQVVVFYNTLAEAMDCLVALADQSDACPSIVRELGKLFEQYLIIREHRIIEIEGFRPRHEYLGPR